MKQNQNERKTLKQRRTESLKMHVKMWRTEKTTKHEIYEIYNKHPSQSNQHQKDPPAVQDQSHHYDEMHAKLDLAYSLSLTTKQRLQLSTQLSAWQSDLTKKSTDQKN